jgi:hypothetical protein
MRKAARATQFCGSSIVRVPTGGKKKKLKQIIPPIDARIEGPSPLADATSRTTNR